MRTYNDPVRIERHFQPRDTRARPSNKRYELPSSLGIPDGFWEPVQRSAQKVYGSDNDYSGSASRLHKDFSGLKFNDDVDGELYIQDRNYRDDERHFYRNYKNQNIEPLEERSYYPGSRNNNGKLSKPVCTRRVVHEPKDRLIQIPVEHVRTIPDQHRYKERRVPVYRRHVGTSFDVVDLSDYDESSSDHSDCDIYPFTLRNWNNNGPEVKTRRARSKKRSEPYSVNLRSNSPSPDADCRIVSPPPTSSHISTHRTYQRSKDNDLERYRKEQDRPFTPPPYSRLSEKYDSSDVLHPDAKMPSTSSSTGMMLHRCPGKYSLIEDNRESAINRGYQFSDEESDSDYFINKDLRRDVHMKEASGSRRDSESDEGITPTPSYPAYNIIRDVIHSEGRQVDYIRGDGNCFFRALSKVIYNTESCHEEIRQAVVDLMEKYPKDFEQFIDEKSMYEHIIYMRKSGTWGTQAEIYGAATLLQRDIYILSPDHSGKKYRWLLFSPRFKQTEVNSFDLCYITLCHTNGNHYDRIAPLVGRCNCALLPPRLSGVKGEVDLTTDSEEDLLVV